VTQTQPIHPLKAITHRNSLQAIQNLDDLSSLDRVVVDKRWSQHSSTKKNRRNRHCKKQFIRNALGQRSVGTEADLI
jgi:hypothetical protein